ncbi:MAG: hypothetical protein Tsb0013_04480 [Phycisphaerales bacterium]
MTDRGAQLPLDPRLARALGATWETTEDQGGTIVVKVDSVERRYRDALKAGATGVEPPRDEVGLGAWRRVARLVDTLTGFPVTIWSDRG